jgi:hypothetical protein
VKIAQIIDANPAIAFRAFYTFITPALLAATRPGLAAVFHPGRNCSQTGHSGHPARLCSDCAAVFDDLTMDIHTRLSRAAAGEPVTTAHGDQVREMTAIVAHLRSADAHDQDLDSWAARLARLPLTDPAAGPAWLRAVKAQLVRYPTTHLVPSLRRARAVTHGAAARPERDLASAAWAAPLRTSREGVALLTALIHRIRQAAADPYSIPDELREQYRLSPVAAETMLRRSLDLLRQLNPGFFQANIEAPLTLGQSASLDNHDGILEAAAADGPEQQTIARESAGHARAVLARLVAGRPTDTAVQSSNRVAYRHLVATIAAHHPADLVTVCRERLALPDKAAARLLRRLARLIAMADGDWVAGSLTADR